METTVKPLDENLANLNTETILEPASKGKRFIHLILDTIAIYIVYFVFALAFGVMGLGHLFESTAFLYLTYFILYFLYYFTMESQLAKTIGKMITKTKVVTPDGFKPTAKTIAGRTLCRIIPFEAFTFLGTRGLHDTLSHTLVVNEK